MYYPTEVGITILKFSDTTLKAPKNIESAVRALNHIAENLAENLPFVRIEPVSKVLVHI
jgi:hypothetical protein